MGCGNSALILDISIISKSICKIEHSSKVYPGFFLRVISQEKDFFCLITTAEIASNDLIEQKEDITFSYDIGSIQKKISLNPEERYIKNFNDSGINLNIIEILPPDDIKLGYFLWPSLDYIDDMNDLKNKEIAITQYLNGKFENVNGKINEINESGFTFTANIVDNSPGYPIILKEDFEVIGVQKSSKSENSENDAVFIGPIINFIKNMEKNNTIEGNYQNVLTEENEDKNPKDKKDSKRILYHRNGTLKYEGDLVDGKAEGNGKFIDKEGNYYIGEFKKGLKHGKGTDYDKNGNIIYEGDFVKDKYEGNGRLNYEDGQYYIGQFKDDSRHGKGILYDKTGDVLYEGDFVENEAEGNGKIILTNGDYYIGQFKKGVKHGKGIYYKKNGNIIYEGYFVDNNKYEGKGKFNYENGEYYLG